MSMVSRPRVLVADDHRLFREAMVKMLEPACEVVGTVGDGRALLSLAHQIHPDIILLDIAMPLMNGLNAGRQLKQLLPRIQLIFLTMYGDADFVAEALAIGASGYILKNSADSELWQAIHAALHRKVFVTPLANHEMVESPIPTPHRKQPSIQLTPRQREVLQLLAEGHSMKEVGNILNVTSRTIAFHKYRMMEELDIKSNADLVRFAIGQGLVSSSFL